MDLRYPIGRFERPETITAGDRQRWIEQVASLPSELLEIAGGMTLEQLNTPYREGGWTVRQLVHHIADSHMNSFVRSKLALTEEEPAIKPYDEKKWAESPDSFAPCEISITLIDALHRRWVVLWKKLDEAQWKRAYIHPESGRSDLETTLALYAWHGRHHVAHIRELRKRMGWT